MDYKLYQKLSEEYARKYAFLKDEVLQEAVLDAFERNNLSEEDDAVITVCLSIKSSKDAVKRLRGGR